jgi:hypothetical protein
MNSEPTELADQILKDLGLENLADPTKSELIELIRERVAQKTMEVILANLPDSNPDDLEIKPKKKLFKKFQPQFLILKESFQTL